MNASKQRQLNEAHEKRDTLATLNNHLTDSLESCEPLHTLWQATHDNDYKNADQVIVQIHADGTHELHTSWRTTELAHATFELDNPTDGLDKDDALETLNDQLSKKIWDVEEEITDIPHR